MSSATIMPSEANCLLLLLILIIISVAESGESVWLAACKLDVAVAEAFIESRGWAPVQKVDLS